MDVKAERDDGSWSSFHYLLSLGDCFQGSYQTLTELHVSLREKALTSLTKVVF